MTGRVAFVLCCLGFLLIFFAVNALTQRLVANRIKSKIMQRLEAD